MQEKTIAEKRANTCDEIDIAKMQIEITQEQLKQNLEYINKILSQIKKAKKAKSCFNYIKSNWYTDIPIEDQLKNVKSYLRTYSNYYEIAVLKRKILKAQLKQAQRKFSKKLKSIVRFDKKYFNTNQ